MVVILYLGNYIYNGEIKDANITPEIFDKGAGKSLNRKGFKYKKVYSYSEAIEELTKNENGLCPYEEVWIFCSRGDGTLPNIVKNQKEERQNLIPFLETVSEYNKRGGALLLFSDNYPFVLETNLLLTKYLNFTEVEGLKNGSANFIMEGNYNNDIKEEKIIKVNDKKDDNTIRSGKFCNEIKLNEKPGQEERLSLRVGIILFNEGITLSYAKPLDDNNKNDYSPFKVFACLSDKKEARPFILYYDPIITKKNNSRGPIVVHGGFTSAFYDFKEEGTGRLVISIACWLVRAEENIRIIMQEKGNKISAINKPLYSKSEFDGWIRLSKTMFSIMILDVSGSMFGQYQNLIKMTNEIIDNQKKNPKNEGLVIFFGNYAKTIIDKEYKTLYESDIHEAKVGGGTSFLAGFSEAAKENRLEYGKNFDFRRVLFLTDGEDNNYSSIGSICQKMKDLDYKVNIIGFGNSVFFQNLRPYASRGCFYTNETFEEIKEICIQAFAA